MSGEALCIDPASLAQNTAMRVYSEAVMGRQPDDSKVIDNLYVTADQFDLIGKPYEVEAARCWAVPADYHSNDPYLDPDEKVSVIDLYGLNFEGIFIRYTKFAIIPKRAGVAAMQGFCLVFNEALLLPDKDHLPDDRVLVVPAPSVNKIRICT